MLSQSNCRSRDLHRGSQTSPNCTLDTRRRFTRLIQGRISSSQKSVEGGDSCKLRRGLIYKLFGILIKYEDDYQGMQEVIFDTEFSRLLVGSSLKLVIMTFFFGICAGSIVLDISLALPYMATTVFTRTSPVLSIGARVACCVRTKLSTLGDTPGRERKHGCRCHLYHGKWNNRSDVRGSEGTILKAPLWRRYFVNYLQLERLPHSTLDHLLPSRG